MVVGGLCVCGISFDDSTQAIDFDRPVISPTCDDTGEIWTAWLEPQVSNYDSQDWKLTIDLTSDKIYVTGHSG